MRRPRTVRPATLVLALVAAFVPAACSDDGGRAEAVAWATQVCGALGAWRSEITDLNRQAQQEVSAAASPDQARERLLTLLSGAESATERAHATAVAAGTPDVAGGADVARSFTASLDGVRGAYEQAGVDLRALSTTDEQVFYDGVVAVLSRLTEAYNAAGVDPSTLNSPELRQAFDEVDQCR